jgi:mannosyltransferase OCH1-like enzyme
MARQHVVPRKIGHIWIGPHPAPLDWMRTWAEAHPAWSYRVYDNDYLCNRRFRNQALINAYFRRGKYAGVSDLMRYEILFDEGGFLPEADSVCLSPVDDLLTEARAYTVYEFADGKSGMMSPFLASEPGNPVIGKVIERLATLDPDTLGSPWTTTGNGFLRRFFLANKALKSEVTIFPSHYFIPEHYKGETYTGPDRIYARQMWATTLRAYPHSRGRTPLTPEEVEARRAEIIERLRGNVAPTAS